MRKTWKRGAALLLAVMVGAAPCAEPMEGLLIVSEAHSGRTDSRGGHKDNKNASGLGSYHYHCGGHPAHLHENGVCPYSVTVTETQAQPAETEKAVPENIALVFDADYYYENNPDLQTAIGADADKLMRHFLDNGMAEGRQGCESFEVHAYKENNEDLADAFGENWASYYDHYMNHGCAEGRVCK